jgi:hypothetical protein
MKPKEWLDIFVASFGVSVIAAVFFICLEKLLGWW